jgi:hypothetical protein
VRNDYVRFSKIKAFLLLCVLVADFEECNNSTNEHEIADSKSNREGDLAPLEDVIHQSQRNADLAKPENRPAMVLVNIRDSLDEFYVPFIEVVSERVSSVRQACEDWNLDSCDEPRYRMVVWNELEVGPVELRHHSHRREHDGSRTTHVVDDHTILIQCSHVTGRDERRQAADRPGHPHHDAVRKWSEFDRFSQLVVVVLVPWLLLVWDYNRASANVECLAFCRVRVG